MNWIKFTKRPEAVAILQEDQRNRPLMKIPFIVLFVCPSKFCTSIFLLGRTMVPRENKNNSYATFGRANKEYYGIFESGQSGH